jgi:hypothetical protein
MAVCNIIHFLSSPEPNELYFDRVHKYLQPDFVLYNFYADSAETFLEITQRPDSDWHILIMDAARLRSDLAIIRTFAKAKQSCTIAVLGSGALSDPELPNMKICSPPPEIDGWLHMMHQLIAEHP